MATTDYASKINALLAKADSTTFEAERTAFTEAAERLMVQWGVSDAMLEDAAQRKDNRPVTKIEQRCYRVEGTSAHYIAEYVNAMAAGGIGSVRTFISHGRPLWWAVGHEDDLRRVEMYIPHLEPQARQAWRTWWRANGWDSTGGAEYERARTSFFRAYGATVRDRFRELFRTEAASTTGAELVLVDRSAKVDAWVADNMQVGKARKTNRTLEYSAMAAGRASGREANLSAGALR